MKFWTGILAIVLLNTGYAMYWLNPWDSPWRWIGYLLGPCLLGLVVSLATKKP